MQEEQRDVIEVLEQDHREVEEMFGELESLVGATTDEANARRKTLTDQVTIEPVRHSVAEEVLVYAQVEKRVSTQEAEHARHEHAEAEETLHRLEKLEADDPAFDAELATLTHEIRHHIAEEEAQTFVHMRQVMDADELRKLGERVQAFKRVAPTRPHPNVPNEPLPRIAAGPAASLFDRMRRPRDRPRIGPLSGPTEQNSLQPRQPTSDLNPRRRCEQLLPVPATYAFG